MEKILKNEVGPTLLHCFQQYNNEHITPDTLPLRLYLTDPIIAYTDREQQDCVQFLVTYEITEVHLIYYLEFKNSIPTTVCQYTYNQNNPMSLIKYLTIPENRSHTLEQLFKFDQNTWVSIPD